METKYIPIEDLRLDSENPRVIKDKQFKVLCNNIKRSPKFFFARPILVNKDMVIFAGNMRYRAAKQLKLKEVPVIIMDVTEEEQKEYMVLDNKNNGTWDMDALANMFDVASLESWGFEPWELKIEVPEPEEEEKKEPKDNLSRQIVLSMSLEEFETFVPRIQRIRNEYGVESNTEAVIRLLEFHESHMDNLIDLADRVSR